MFIGQGGRGLRPVKIKKPQKPKAPKKQFGRIPPAPERPREEHFSGISERPVPIAVQAMQAIRSGEIESGRSNFDRDFPIDQYSLTLQGSDITPPRHPNLGYMEPRDDYRDEYIRGTPKKQSRVVYEDDIPVKTGKKRFAGHTVTFIFGLSLLGIVFLGFYFGKKKPLYF